MQAETTNLESGPVGRPVDICIFMIIMEKMGVWESKYSLHKSFIFDVIEV